MEAATSIATPLSILLCGYRSEITVLLTDGNRFYLEYISGPLDSGAGAFIQSIHALCTSMDHLYGWTTLYALTKPRSL